jgi:hypothetical protein
MLWSKPLPNGKIFELQDNKKGVYLYHQSELGEFSLGSDAITQSIKLAESTALLMIGLI